MARARAKPLVVLSTAPKVPEAEKIADALVRDGSREYLRWMVQSTRPARTHAR